MLYVLHGGVHSVIMRLMYNGLRVNVRSSQFVVMSELCCVDRPIYKLHIYVRYVEHRWNMNLCIKNILVATEHLG